MSHGIDLIVITVLLLMNIFQQYVFLCITFLVLIHIIKKSIK